MPGRSAPALAKLPPLLIAAFFACLAFPRTQQHDNVVWTFVAVGSGLAVWWLLLWRTGRASQVEFVPPVKQHYIQACVQTVLYCYWGAYWTPIQSQVPLILAQFVFVFAFDALFAWTRGRTWRLTSGPVPIVLSTNLFIWFTDAAFAWQFAMIALGLLGKEFVKWEKEGRRTHIFNPSGLGLMVTAVALVATGTTDEITLARPLATTIDGPPHIFLVLFLLGLVVQHFFAVTLMTFAATATIVVSSYAYAAISGTDAFVGSNLPAAGFLGLHLLMTDPSTSPRSNLGRLLFGIGYGLGYVVMYVGLGWLGNLELFAKLMPVPILNLCVRWLDRIGREGATGRMNASWEGALRPSRMNHLHMLAWAALAIPLVASGWLQGIETGDTIGKWKQAWLDDRFDAERKLRIVLQSKIGLKDGLVTGEAANELGLVLLRSPDPAERDGAKQWFAGGSNFGSPHAARNFVLFDVTTGTALTEQERGFAIECLRADVKREPKGPSVAMLGLAHEFGRGVPRDAGAALKLYRERGLDDLFAAKGIARLGLSAEGRLFDLTGIEPALAKAVASGDVEAMWYLAYLHATGRGVVADATKARELFAVACRGGLAKACEAEQLATLPPFSSLPPELWVLPPWSTAWPLGQ